MIGACSACSCDMSRAGLARLVGGVCSCCALLPRTARRPCQRGARAAAAELHSGPRQRAYTSNGTHSSQDAKVQAVPRLSLAAGCASRVLPNAVGSQPGVRSNGASEHSPCRSNTHRSRSSPAMALQAVRRYGPHRLLRVTSTWLSCHKRCRCVRWRCWRKRCACVQPRADRGRRRLQRSRGLRRLGQRRF